MNQKIFQPVFLLALVLFGCTRQSEFKSIDVAGVDTPVVLLNGSWKFSMAPPEKFWEDEVDFQSWADIQVPGECQMQGFAIKHDQPYAYKHQIVIPADYTEKQILLNFYGVYSYARVWINGHFVREHYGGFTKWSCDITEFVTAGEHASISVEIVDRSDDISYGSGYAKHQIGGILRDVELVALPLQNFKQFYVETDLDEKYQNADLKVSYELAQASPATIKVELYDDENTLISESENEASSRSGQFSIPVINPEKWDAEHPNLYTLVTSLLEDGKEILKTREKIGFREVVIEGNILLVNGMPVKLRGACRHDIHPTLGRMTTAEYDKLDVQRAKDCNMNFIRTSHYPPSEAFLNYCDEYGVYVEDETAVCFVGSHRMEAYKETGATQNDPDFKGRYLSQLEEMVQNHRMHPSIIIWSIGNENNFGDNFLESYKWLKQNDLSRPVIYSYPGQVPDSLLIYDLVSMHYPTWDGKLDQYGIAITDFSYEAMPVLYDEWAHVACYNNPTLRYDPNVRNFWGESLDKMWTNLFDADGGLGGAIWCMIDETFMLPDDLEGSNEWWGILDENIIPSTYMGPTVGYGEWGIVDSWRRKKPEFWGTKKAYSPTKIYIKQIVDFQANEEMTIPVHNRFDHTNFSELKISWKYGSNSGILEDINLEAHKRGEITIPKNNWVNDTKLNICFYQNDTMLVDEYNIQMGEKVLELPVCKTGTLDIKDLNEELVIAGKNFELIIDKKVGLLENVKINGEELIKSGPYINLKIPGNRVQYSTITMEDYAENWNCTDFKYEVNEGIITISTEGKYDKIDAIFLIKIDENGIFNIDYNIENSPEGIPIQELGLKFITGESFDSLTWMRNSYFTAYPESHIGRHQGRVNLNSKPEMKYRKAIEHEWEMDSKGFYYFGLDEELPFTNVARSLKENVYSYSLETKTNSRLEVFSEGTQACRYDIIDNNHTLLINDKWDYLSLLWGNYMKMLPSEKVFKGSAVIMISN